VKQFAYRDIEVNYNSLLTDAELPEDLVENILDIDAPQQTANCLRRRAQLFGHQLIALPSDRKTAA
jgi:hypothetical protein